LKKKIFDHPAFENFGANNEVLSIVTAIHIMTFYNDHTEANFLSFGFFLPNQILSHHETLHLNQVFVPKFNLVDHPSRMKKQITTHLSTILDSTWCLKSIKPTMRRINFLKSKISFYILDTLYYFNSMNMLVPFVSSLS